MYIRTRAWCARKGTMLTSGVKYLLRREFERLLSGGPQYCTLRVRPRSTKLADNCSSFGAPRPFAFSADAEGLRLVYTGPLNGAVRAIKVFSLSTAVASLASSPVLVVYGSVTVPLAARIAMSSIVLAIGISTTAILHWIAKAYVTKLFYNSTTGAVVANTLNLFGRTKRNEFHVTEARPPAQLTAFCTFQAKGRSYFLHSEAVEDKAFLSSLLGVYSVLETSDPLATKNTLSRQYIKKKQNNATAEN